MSSLGNGYRFPNYPWVHSRKHDKGKLWKPITQRLKGFFSCFKPMKSGTNGTEMTCQPKKIGEGDHVTRGDIHHTSDPQLKTGCDNSLIQHHATLPLDAMEKLTYVTSAGQYPSNFTLDEFVSSDDEETCGNLSQEDTEDKEIEEGEKEEKEENELTKWWKGTLASDKVDDVKLSNLLANEPCVVIPSKYRRCTDMDWIMLSETLSDASRCSYMKGSKVLVINPKHPIIKELWELVVKDPGNARVKEVAELMCQTALMQCSCMLIDTKDFATQIYDLVKSGLNICPDTMKALKEPEVETKLDVHGTSNYVTDEL